MIGWYVDVGYIDGEIYNVTNLSEITFLDINKPFTIMETNSDSVSYIQKNREEVFEYYSHYFGNDISSLYLVPGIFQVDWSTRWKDHFNNLVSLFPSLVKSYPLTWELELQSGSRRTFFYLFKSLNKLVSHQGRVFSVSGNSCSFIGDINPVGFNQLIVTTNTNSINMINVVLTRPYSDNYVENLGISQGIFEYPVSGDSTKSRFDIVISNTYKFNLLFSNSDVPDFTIVSPDNPYEPGGPSGEGGGGGTFDNESDQISDSSLPTLSSANTGFTRIYNPTLSQVQSLAQYLWTDESVISTIWNHIKQFFENPMEAIIAFNLVPVPVPDGGTKNFALMYIDTGVQMTVAANQFVDVDCGTLEVKEYYGSALDYSPNTKISCFLPFIGTVTLNTDEVMNTTLQVKYRVDICSGSCVAKILVNGNVLYQYSGHCAIPIPLSAADFSTYVTAAISVGKLVGTALTAGAGVAAAVGAEDAAQQTNQIVTTTQITNTARNPATGRQITTGTQTVVETREAPADQSSTQASFNGLSAQNIANTVGQVMSSKPHIEHSGGFSGNSGYLGIRRPFLIIERPNMCMPANFQSLNGFPSMITLELGTCKGFTRVQQVQLTGVTATNPEQAELLQLLKSGVIL